MEMLDWLGTLPPAEQMKRSAGLYMVVNATHILAIGLLLGAILPLDLRLLGLFRSFPLDVLGPFLSRAAAVGVAIAIATGFPLFLVRPEEYLGNPAFLGKIGLLVLGLVNVGVLHLSDGWRLVVTKGISGAGV